MSFHSSTAFANNNPLGADVYTQRNIEVQRIEQTGNFTIPAGARLVKIENAGEIGGGLLAVATVNGQNFDVNANPIEFETSTDESAKEVLLSPEYVIRTNGAMIFATVHR